MPTEAENMALPCRACGSTQHTMAGCCADLTFYTDGMRHLVCVPYSVENLHRMARYLGIKPCWFHRGASHPHYDIPLKLKADVEGIQKTRIVDGRTIVRICKGEAP